MLSAATRSRLLSTHRWVPIAPRWSRPPERKNAHRGLAGSCRAASRPTRSQVSIASGENSRCCTKARRTPLLPQGDLDEVTVTSHHYSIGTPTTCTPSDAFSSLEAGGMSAPGAPAITHDGVTLGISLWHVVSPNLIDQFVDTPSMTITNTALPGHAFLGQVTTQVVPMGSGSRINTVGNGVPGESWARGIANDVAGYILFGLRNYIIQTGCDAANGIPNNG